MTKHIFKLSALLSVVLLATVYSTIKSDAKLILKPNGKIAQAKLTIDKSPEGLVKFAKQKFQEVLAGNLKIDEALEQLKALDAKLGEVLERVLKLFASQPDLLTASEEVKTQAILKLFTMLEKLSFKANLERLAGAFKDYTPENFEDLLSTSQHAHESLRAKVATRRKQKETEKVAVQAAQTVGKRKHQDVQDQELDESATKEIRLVTN